MARGRMISKTLGTSSRKFARLRTEHATIGLFAQALYPLLVANSDDFGRQHGDPFTVKHCVWSTAPEDEQAFDVALDALHAVGLIVRYHAAHHHYLQVIDFELHQQGLHKRGESKYPGPPDIPGTSLLTELNLTQQNRTSDSSEPLTARSLLTFPTVGREGKTWTLTEAQVAEWATAYPTLGVLAECRKALAWVKADQTRRKTGSGMLKFLVNWLNRTTNAGGSREAAPGRVTPVAVDWNCTHDPHCRHRAECEVVSMRKVSA